MARTQLNAKQILNGSIQIEDLDITTPGKSVITKILPGEGISINNTGRDTGTGIVTISSVPQTTFEHTQNDPQTVWLISHNLNRFPSISVVDSSGRKVYGEETYIDDNTVKIEFSAAFSGKAYLN